MNTDTQSTSNSDEKGYNATVGLCQKKTVATKSKD